MKILVDADACPVKEIILSVAKEYGIKVIMYIDTAHILNLNDCEIVTVDKGKDSVDMKLSSNIKEGDIVVTQDYGVASMALLRNASSLNQNGLIFTHNNIDRLLFERYLSSKARRAGKKTINPSKRTKDDDLHFEKALRLLISKGQGI